MTKAILLVGGFGTRLRPLTDTVPKPMLPVAGLPVTEHQLAAARRAGITSIVLATSYLSDVFVPYFGDGSRWGMHIQYAIEEKPLGTGGAIRNAAQLLTLHEPNEPIVIFNGDLLSDHDLAAQIDRHVEADADVTLHLTHVPDARAYGCVPVDQDGRVTAFLEKMDVPITNTINAGCYVFNPRVIEQIPANTVVSVEREIFPSLIERGKKVLGFIDDSYWLDIGTPHALLQGSIDLVQGRAQSGALHEAKVLFHSSEYVAMDGANISSLAVIRGGSSIGPRAEIQRNTTIIGSIVCEGAVVGEGTSLDRCFVAENVIVPNDAKFEHCYIGENGVTSLIA